MWKRINASLLLLVYVCVLSWPQSASDVSLWDQAYQEIDIIESENEKLQHSLSEALNKIKLSELSQEEQEQTLSQAYQQAKILETRLDASEKSSKRYKVATIVLGTSTTISVALSAILIAILAR